MGREPVCVCGACGVVGWEAGASAPRLGVAVRLRVQPCPRTTGSASGSAGPSSVFDAGLRGAASSPGSGPQ